MNVFVISRGIPSEKYPLYGIFEFDQAKALQENGINVSMLVINFLPIFKRRKFGLLSYKKQGVNVFELSLPVGAYRRGVVFLQELLCILYRKAVKSAGKPDLIHAHFYFIGSIASILKKRYHIPLVITEHSSKLNKDFAQISKIDCKIANNAYKNADLVISVSKILSQNLKQNFRTDSKVIHDIIDLRDFPYVTRHKKETFAFVSVGNLIYRKGFDVLIEAFSEAFKNDKSVFLQIIGEGTKRTALQALIDQLGLQNQVKLLGMKTRIEIFEIMKDCDAFALASRNETFGVSYVEALSTGLPCIATLCGGPDEFMEDKMGYSIPIDDKSALSQALKDMKLKCYDFDSKEISDTCRSSFSGNHISEQIIAQYDDLLQGK